MGCHPFKSAGSLHTDNHCTYRSACQSLLRHHHCQLNTIALWSKAVIQGLGHYKRQLRCVCLCECEVRVLNESVSLGKWNSKKMVQGQISSSTWWLQRGERQLQASCSDLWGVLASCTKRCPPSLQMKMGHMASWATFYSLRQLLAWGLWQTACSIFARFGATKHLLPSPQMAV